MVFGVAKMPNDPFESLRAELKEFDSMISSITACANGVQAGIDLLASAPIAMMDPLDRFFPDGSPSRDIMTRLCSQLRGFADHVRRGDREIQAVHQILQDMSAQNAHVHDEFKGRDQLFLTNHHYTTKVDRLQEQLSRNVQNTRLAEKHNRNVKKKSEHQAAFQDAMSEVSKKVNGVLEHKQSRIAEAVSKICEYYAVVFEAAARLVNDFAEVGKLLVLQSSSEDYMRKGQQLAAQAQQKLSSFASGGGRTAASAGGTDGYPVAECRSCGGSAGGGGYMPGSGASAPSDAGRSASGVRRGGLKAEQGAPFMNSSGSPTYGFPAGDSAGGPSNAGWSGPVNTWPGASGAENSGATAPWARAQQAFMSKAAQPVAQAAASQAMRDPWAAQTAAKSATSGKSPWA
eukprot:CAMPEP_0172763204 /NCGR_PEP_ID=MMETSP1074-20121228/174886_1 /TAXON_ID=2916 /ORGANISM="Ceratium fusus, Strain PA161109" /LENGTH=401 /DNA_ID=CAMNT_0013597739 /DNA_START=74 /DNA_END=1279 /DNA_ORIENTATION=-